MPTTLTLRFTPWSHKDRLSPAQYTSLVAAVSRVLRHAVSIPDDKLDVAWAQAFVRSYVQDGAAHNLQTLDEKVIELSPHELSIRKLTLRLAQRLARIRGWLDVSLFVDLAVAYGTANATSLRTIFEEAYKSTSSLLESYNLEVIPAFTAALQDVQSRPSSSTRKVAYMLSQLLGCGSPISTPFVQSKKFVLALAACYQIGLEDFATSHGGMKLNSSESVVGWQRDWLYTKTGLLDSFHAIMQALVQGNLSDDRDRLFDLLFTILELPSTSTSESVSPVPFITQSLLADYQYAFDLSSILTDRYRGADDARVDLLAATLAKLSPSHGKKSAGGFSTLLKVGSRSRQMAPVSVSKGKAKAAAQQIPELQKDAALDLAISQVLDILPSYRPQYIRRCLEHPIFHGDHEKLISSLLEEALPPELVDDNETLLEDVPRTHDFKYIKDRRNVWDEESMDFSKLRIGKARDDADDLLQDRSFVEQMKADIIRRVEELSDEEEDYTPKSRERTVAFEEDVDDTVDSFVDQGIRVAGDGEASDETDNEPDTGYTVRPQVNLPETILELAYLDNPKLFDRDSATRRSKARAELKAKTAWGDEQIEGWRIMLERNPKKDKILQKHEFSGNIPLASTSNATEPGSNKSSRGASSGRGRAGGTAGRGRGGARNVESDAARDRAWKDKNKARNANHNRKRGHDKKMARGGGPVG